jgi:hypothetical protein
VVKHGTGKHGMGKHGMGKFGTGKHGTGALPAHCDCRVNPAGPDGRSRCAHPLVDRLNTSRLELPWWLAGLPERQ